MWWLESEKSPPLVCQLLMDTIMECNENHINSPVRTATRAYSENAFGIPTSLFTTSEVDQGRHALDPECPGNISSKLVKVNKSREEMEIMPNKTSEPDPAKKKKKEVEVRDLKPKSDAKGGATKPNKDEKRTFARTGEADFMGP